MMESDTIFDVIARERPGLSAAELKVADLVLTLPELPLSVSMRALARRADVSDATVLRFCRLLGLKGYPDFKLAVARATRPPTRPEDTRRAAHEDGALVKDLGGAVLRQAEGAAEALADGRLSEIAERLAASGFIDVFAFGISRVAGWDFANQMTACGVTASVVSDPHIQVVRASRMDRRSSAMFLSIGFSRLLGDMATSVGETGAYTVAVTTPGTPLSSVCADRIDLSAGPGENAGTPRHARYGQLLVLDVLAERVRESLGMGSVEGPAPDAGSQFTF